MNYYLDVLFATFLTILIVGFALFVGVQFRTDPRLEQCKKQQNVYQCKMVAVPVEDER